MYLQIIATGIKYPVYENDNRVIPVTGYISRTNKEPRFKYNEHVLQLFVSEQTKDTVKLEETKAILKTLLSKKLNDWYHINRFNYKKFLEVFPTEHEPTIKSIFKSSKPVIVKYINYLQHSPKDISKLWEYIEYAHTQWGLEQEEILSLTLSYLQQ